MKSKALLRGGSMMLKLQLIFKTTGQKVLWIFQRHCVGLNLFLLNSRAVNFNRKLIRTTLSHILCTISICLLKMEGSEAFFPDKTHFVYYFSNPLSRNSKRNEPASVTHTKSSAFNQCHSTRRAGQEGEQQHKACRLARPRQLQRSNEDSCPNYINSFWQTIFCLSSSHL